MVGSVFSIKAQAPLRVGILDRSENRNVLISPDRGSYVLLQDQDTIYRFRNDDAISVSVDGNSIIVKSIYGFIDTLGSVVLMGSGPKRSFKLKRALDGPSLDYSDNLSIDAVNGRLKLVNQVDIENYVARVMQSEVGAGAAPEYYKIQSIICRTYAYRNLARHEADGYDLCDHEHCQVYHGSKPPSDDVQKATAATNGLIMVDDKDHLILSAFHANCGGQTANSEDVWMEERSYLTSVVDTFCTRSRSATWEKTVNRAAFLSQLGFKTDAEATASFIFKQDERKKMLTVANDSILLSRARVLLQLRSAFFDIRSDGEHFLLNGRGYGHGVGLCQQGAMRMAEHGYDHSQILGYYYKGVSLKIYDHQSRK